MRAIVCAALFLSSSVNAQSKLSKENMEFLKYECSAFVQDAEPISFDYSNLTSLSNQTLRNRSLYLFSKKQLAKDWLVIDVTRNESVIANTLKLPLHALKLKKYLADKRIILLGDGVNYKQLEHEALQLSKHYVKEVKLYFGGVDNWLKEGASVSQPLTITAAQYAVESQLGDWIYIYNKSELLELLASRKLRKKSVDPLTRYLLMNEQLTTHIELAEGVRYQLFELQGGEQVLEQFFLDQSRMLSASQERELRSRCKGTPHA